MRLVLALAPVILVGAALLVTIGAPEIAALIASGWLSMFTYQYLERRHILRD